MRGGSGKGSGFFPWVAVPFAGEGVGEVVTEEMASETVADGGVEDEEEGGTLLEDGTLLPVELGGMEDEGLPDGEELGEGLTLAVGDAEVEPEVNVGNAEPLLACLAARSRG